MDGEAEVGEAIVSFRDDPLPEELPKPGCGRREEGSGLDGPPRDLSPSDRSIDVSEGKVVEEWSP